MEKELLERKLANETKKEIIWKEYESHLLAQNANLKSDLNQIQEAKMVDKHLLLKIQKLCMAHEDLKLQNENLLELLE